MRFQTPLVPARLLRRYKRFLADALLEGTGQEVTAHCPNPGAMTGLAEPGQRIWLEPVTGRKMAFGWRLTELPGGHLAGIDTGVPNRIVRDALEAEAIPALAGYGGLRAEVAYGNRSRVDFLLSGAGRPETYVEVKNVHLMRRPGLAEFPDCVTARGTRHLHDLAAVARAGGRAVMLYVVQRTDCTAMRLAADIDPAYSAAATAAHAAGVEMIAHGTEIAVEGVRLATPLPAEI